MLNILLVMVLLVIFAFGFYVADSFGRFMDKEPRRRSRFPEEGNLFKIRMNGRAEPEEAHTLLDLLSDREEGDSLTGKADELRGKTP